MIKFEALGISSPILDIAKKIEEVALQDPYFIDRKLYPNVDFYSGILQALGFPTNTLLFVFAIGRAPGWLATGKKLPKLVRESIAQGKFIKGLALEHINHCLSS